MKRPFLIVVAALVVAGGSWLGAWLSRADAQGDFPLDLSLAPTANGSTLQEVNRLIGEFELLTADTVSPFGEKFLGQLYLHKAQWTADVQFYRLAETRLEKALDLYPTDTEASTALLRVRLALHEFSEVAALAETVIATNPAVVDALAALGDARLELGAYVEAEAIYGDLARKLPGNPAVQVRQANLAFLQGDDSTALQYARDAAAAAATSGFVGRTLAFYQVYLADLAVDSGRVDEAAEAIDRAIGADPEWTVPLGTKAEIAAARGDLDVAMNLYREALTRFEDPGWRAALGDLYLLNGDPAMADEQFALFHSSTSAPWDEALYARERATFFADHQTDLDEALRLATADLARRPDVFAYDTLAWVLYRNGDVLAAEDAIGRALTLGTPDPEMLFHAGLIAAAQGQQGDAMAYLEDALDHGLGHKPLLAAEARETLEGLRA